MPDYLENKDLLKQRNASASRRDARLAGFEPSALIQNLEALNELKKLKPSSAKGVYFKKVTVSSTMGPGLAVDQASLKIN